MDRFFSTCALGLLAICLGSVTTCGAGSVCAATRVLMTMTNGMTTRMLNPHGRSVMYVLPLLASETAERSGFLRVFRVLSGSKSISYAFAPLCTSTVLHVLSSAWHNGSIGQSTHFGFRAMHK